MIVESKETLTRWLTILMLQSIEVSIEERIEKPLDNDF